MSRPGTAPRLVLAAAALVVAGCWGGKQKQPARAPATPPLRIEVTAARDSNQGGSLVVVVRKTDRAGFLAEDYDAIADGVFSEPRDPAVLRVAIVQPGHKVTLDVPRAVAQGEVLGLYFLFSTPGNRWRLAVGDVAVPGVRVRLGASGIASVEKGKVK